MSTLFNKRPLRFSGWPGFPRMYMILFWCESEECWKWDNKHRSKLKPNIQSSCIMQILSYHCNGLIILDQVHIIGGVKAEYPVLLTDPVQVWTRVTVSTSCHDRVIWRNTWMWRNDIYRFRRPGWHSDFNVAVNRWITFYSPFIIFVSVLF